MDIFRIKIFYLNINFSEMWLIFKLSIEISETNGTRWVDARQRRDKEKRHNIDTGGTCF